jgi:hypothetical protein
MFGDIGISDPALDSGAAQMIYIHYDEDHRVKNVVNDAGSTLHAPRIRTMLQPVAEQ